MQALKLKNIVQVQEAELNKVQDRLTMVLYADTDWFDSCPEEWKQSEAGRQSKAQLDALEVITDQVLVALDSLNQILA